MSDSPLKQVIKQMDEEGQIVFQGTMMAGLSPRQALYNAFGLCWRGDEIDHQPFFDKDLKPAISPGFKDQRLNELFETIDNQEIEKTFWEVWGQ